MYNLNKTGILKILHELDNTLTTPQEITLCGSGAILLQDLEFRQTMDIDFTITPPAQITKGCSVSFSANADKHCKPLRYISGNVYENKS
jgi:hypothetical protein